MSKITRCLVALLLLVAPLALVSPVEAKDPSSWDSLSVGQVVAYGTPVQGGCYFSGVSGTTTTNERVSRNIDLKVDNQCVVTVAAKSEAHHGISSKDPTNNEVDLRDPFNIILNEVLGTAYISLCDPNICISSYVYSCSHLNDGWVTDDCFANVNPFVGNPAHASNAGDFHWTGCCNSFQHQQYHAEDIYNRGGGVIVLVCSWGWSGTISGANHFTNECFFS